VEEGGPGQARQSVQSSLKNVYRTAILWLRGLAAIVASRAGFRMDGTDDCEAWNQPENPVPQENRAGNTERIQRANLASESSERVQRAYLARESARESASK